MKQKSWIQSFPAFSEDPTHPLQILLRTYALSLSLSLGPSLIPFISSRISSKSSPRTSLVALKRVLRREFGFDGFAFAITVCVGGGAAIRRLWHILDSPSQQASSILPMSVRTARRQCITYLQMLTSYQKTFLANVLSSSLGVLLLQAGYRRSRRLTGDRPSSTLKVPHTKLSTRTNRALPTLDLTLLLFVRAMDAILQIFIQRVTKPAHRLLDNSRRPSFTEPSLMRDRFQKNATSEKSIRDVTSRTDAFVFWACSARIMWCFFYEPQRLPSSYVKWIATLASLDGRILHALRLLRDGRWTYTNGSPSHSHILRMFSKELGYNASWGDPAALPAYGGAVADAAWKTLGVKTRPGVGGLPCELVHGGIGSNLGLENSCTANSSLRGLKAFVEAIAIYLPVHFIPVLLTRPRTLFQKQYTFRIVLGAVRSASFLSSFVASFWYAVCFTRSLVFARIFPFISHDFWDGPTGCILAGCFVCGSSIWIENGRRRGEMALYVLPRAVRTLLPENWIRNGSKKVQLAERLAFILSFSALMTTAMHHPKALRGLSRWTLAFVTNGPTTGFWKRKRRDRIELPTPNVPPTAPIPVIQNQLTTPSIT